MYEMDGMGWEAQQQLEERQQWEEEKNWQSLLDNDPEYHEWADRLDEETALERHYEELAAMEDERHFRTLQPWD